MGQKAKVSFLTDLLSLPLRLFEETNNDFAHPNDPHQQTFTCNVVDPRVTDFVSLTMLEGMHEQMMSIFHVKDDSRLIHIYIYGKATLRGA